MSIRCPIALTGLRRGLGEMFAGSPFYQLPIRVRERTVRAEMAFFA
ncbi:MAG: hypothetical protein IPK82_30185 [Polyangiaceae bacterium]|nr:hypothetical protein [Polyangiaceae bacterium]